MNNVVLMCSGEFRVACKNTDNTKKNKEEKIKIGSGLKRVYQSIWWRAGQTARCPPCSQQLAKDVEGHGENKLYRVPWLIDLSGL